VFRGGWPGNIEPRSDRIAGRKEVKPGYLEVSDPDAAQLAAAKTVRPGEIFFREQARDLGELLFLCSCSSDGAQSR
jgi:hypothetical protein